ncbi:MAG: hypothetical protein IBJ11_03140 [Phycisphaerales bacterium]|nr:hypothetical protein [Phycisphaerales bacterium]
MGWTGVSNGRLVTLAAAAGFEAMLTMDRGFERVPPDPPPFTIVVLAAPNNRMATLALLVPSVLAALASASAGTVVSIAGPTPEK